MTEMEQRRDLGHTDEREPPPRSPHERADSREGRWVLERIQQTFDTPRE